MVMKKCIQNGHAAGKQNKKTAFSFNNSCHTFQQRPQLFTRIGFVFDDPFGIIGNKCRGWGGKVNVW